MTMSESGEVSRRGALATMGAVGAGVMSAAALAQGGMASGGRGFLRPTDLGWDPEKREYTLPPLPYAYDALEPNIDEQTMRIHHDRHHAGYVRGLNRALARLEELRTGGGDPATLKHWMREVSFHGGGHINHTLFWRMMAPENGRTAGPSRELARHIERDFGSLDAMLAQFKAASTAVEGSGWGWLVFEPNSGRLLVTQMEKQQNLFLTGAAPLLGVDVWEHAYYLKYQNRRGDYVDAFTDVINWAFVDELFAQARGM